MRSIKQLLELLKKAYLKEITYDINSGLCSTVVYMNGGGPAVVFESCFINDEEYSKLSDYLSKNKPKGKKERDYWWPIDDIESRLKWLDLHIRK